MRSVVFALCGLVAACGSAFGQDALKLVGTYPLEGDALTDSFIVYFSDAVDWKSQDGHPLTFEPDLKGTFTYGERHVLFRPDTESLKQRAEYQATISPTLRSVNGAALTAPENPIRIVTHAVKMRGAEFSKRQGSRIELFLRFTDRLASFESADQVIRVVDAQGATVATKLTATDEVGVLRLEMPTDIPLPATVTILPGLKSNDGRFVMSRSESFVYPAKDPLTVRQALWRNGGFDALNVYVQFSGAVSASDVKELVTLHRPGNEDAIAFTLATTGMREGHQLVLDSEVPNADALELRIPEGIVSREMRRFPEAKTITLQPNRGDPGTTSQNIQYHFWRPQGANGVELELRFALSVSAEELKDRITVEPPIKGMEVKPGSYSHAVRVLGDWSEDEAYRIQIAAEEGNEDSREMRQGVGKPPHVEGVTFSHADKYFFPRSQPGMLQVKSRNVDETKVLVYRLFPNNIVPAMQYVNGENVNSSFSSRLGQPIGEQALRFSGKRNETLYAPVDVSGILGDRTRGVFSVQLSGHQEYEDTKILLWTDIGAVAHWQSDALAIYAHDLYSLSPLAGATVTVHSSKNQVMATGVTNAEGIALLSDLDESLGWPVVATIETPDDFSFVELKTRDAVPEAFDAAEGGYDAEGYDSYLYSDRSIYRPGETVHLRWLVRTGYGDALADVPLMLEIRNEQNQKMLNEAVTLSEFGTGQIDFETTKTFATGKYLALLKIPGSDRSLQVHNFNLEEFVPNRIAVKVAIDDAVWQLGETQGFEVLAENLFGGAAARRKSEGSVILRKGEYESERWSSYVFTNDAPFSPEVRSLGEQTTDEEGRARFEFKETGDLTASAPLSVTARGQVFELGGRAVTATNTTTLFPSDTALGLLAEPTNGGKDLHVRVVAMHPDESPAELSSVKVAFERQTWYYTIRRFNDHNQPWWERSYEPVQTIDVPLTEGQGECAFELPYYGQFRVRVYSDATPQYSTQSFYKYGNQVRLQEGEEPSLVTLSLDRAAYHVGDTALLKIESPYPGKAVVCFQGEAIEGLQTVELVDNRAEVRIPLEVGYTPNVWAEVTVVHEDGDGKTHPYSSFSVVDIPVRETRRRLTVTLPELPEEVRPQQTITVRVQVADSIGRPARAEIALAAVDEGIHTILGYENPDPASWFERSRRPAFNRATYYDRVAYNFDASEIGGGMLAKRLADDSSVTENWIKPVALWSGSVVTDESGFAEIGLEIPEFNGQLRLVAVGASAEASGAVSERLYVRRPYILRTSMPRFVLPGDVFTCNAVVFNTTQDSYTARLRWHSAEALEEREGERALELSAGGEQQLRAEFLAGRDAGRGRLNWEVDIVDGDGNLVETLRESALIPVMHPAVYETNREFKVIQPGESATFRNQLYVDNGSASSSIHVTGNPAARLAEALDYVVRYPYGCVEQTTSACMPLYLLNQYSDLAESTPNPGVDVESYLQAGIDRLFSMQTSQGGLGYWPGADTPHPYGSVYACHFLTLVLNDPKVTVPESQFRELQRYVRGVADQNSDRSTGEYYVRAYATYVLALDGKVSRPEEIERFDTVSMPTSGRYWLAAALALSTRDLDRAREYVASYPRVNYNVRERSGNFNSSIRGVAVELMTMIDLENDLAKTADRAEQLIRFLETTKYPNTQEYAFVATALGRYLSKNAGNLDSMTATISHEGNTVSLQGKSIFTEEVEGIDGGYRVENTGPLPVYVNFVTAGIPKSPVIARIENGIGISRQFRESGGGAVVDTTFAHGDSYVVTLTLECEQAVENVVVADLLPAGFEVENPRIDEDSLVALKIPNQSTVASYVDVRDDRLILAFDRLDRGTHQFHYVVRAVTPGVFQYPGAVAECMYDASVHGNSGLGSVSILRDED